MHDETKQIVNKAMEDIEFSFKSISKEEMKIISGGIEIKEKWKKTINEFAENFDQDDPEYITLREAFMQRFKEHGFVIDSIKEFNEQSEALEDVLKKLAEDGADFIVLAGFLKKIPDAILRAYPKKILNIHPALLPKHGGKGMYGMRVHQAVVAAGDTESGITIHFINDRYDEGQVVFQARCPVAPTDTPEDVATKVHALEYAHYPAVIERVLLGENLHESF